MEKLTWDKLNRLLNLSPLILLTLIPFMRFKLYVHRTDFITRAFFLLFIVLFLIVYLNLEPIKNVFRKRIMNLLENISRINIKNLIFLLFFISLAIYTIFLFAFLSKNISFSGDEPHYLLISHSILKDGDINLRNNYIREDYKTFFPYRLRPHATWGIKGPSEWYSIHLPGLSYLVLPAYWISTQIHGWADFIVRFFMILLSAFLGIQIFLFAKDEFKNLKIALSIWAIYSFSVPILFYSFHVYPEIPMISFSVYVLRIVRFNKLNLFNSFFCGVLLSTFPWFGVKYNIILISIFLFLIYSAIKNKIYFIRIIPIILIPLISYLFFLNFMYSKYGTISTFAVYEGTLTPEKMKYLKDLIMRKISLKLRIDSFLDYFFDQRDGLLPYSPFYFFSFLGLVEILRKSKIEFFLWSILSFSFLFNYAFLTHRGGWCPPARPFTAVSFAFIIFLGFFLKENKSKFFMTIFFLSLCLSILISVFLTLDPLALYQPTTHDVKIRAGALFYDLSNLYISLPKFLPSFIKIDNWGYIPNYFWVFLTVALIFIYIFKIRKPEFLKKININKILTLIFTLLLVFIFVVFPRIRITGSKRAIYLDRTKVSFHSIDETTLMEDFGKFSLFNKGKFDFVFTSFKKINRIKFLINRKKIKAKASLFSGDVLIYKGLTEKEFEKSIENPPFFPYKDRYLYFIRLKIYDETEISEEPPFVLSIIPSSK
ncbi:MAG: hypothetical protein AB1410_06750 [Acidobacteriota bacterium]